MDLDQLKQILDLVHQHELSEFEIEHDGLRLKIRKDAVAAIAPVQAGGAAGGARAGSGSSPSVSAVAHAGGDGAPATVGEDGGADSDIELAVIKSPIVGTFYRSPEPAAPAFVEIGSVVKKGQVLCIIEAMKLMNEIDSECDGEIVNVYVENGQPVQYGERLFAVRLKVDV